MSQQNNYYNRFNQNNYNQPGQYGSYGYSEPYNDGSFFPPQQNQWQNNQQYQQQQYYPQQGFFPNQGYHPMSQPMPFQGYQQPFQQPAFQLFYQQPLQTVEEQKQANNSQSATVFKRFEDFKPFTFAPVATPQLVPAVMAPPEDPLTVQMREELKVPEEHIKSLKEIIERVQIARKNDPQELTKCLMELKNHHVCTLIQPSEKSLWSEQFERLKFMEAQKIAIVKKNIKLIVNVIIPDNFDKKCKELRQYIFGNHKLPSEPGYKQEVDTITDEKINEINIQIVVDQIFRKAQNEKTYCSIYGNLCEQMIKLELNLKNLRATTTTMKQSLFRRLLINNCRTSFDEFFSTKEAKDDNKLRLLNNIRFVGELFRRKLLAESIILEVFDLLLGIQKSTDCINDNTVLGAIQLMEKVGYLVDDKLKTIIQRQAAATPEKPFKEEDAKQAEKINAIFTRFADFRAPDSDALPKVSNQIKCLIKNMFEYREGGWLRQRDAEAAGPMRVEELHRREEEKKAEEMKRIEENDREYQKVFQQSNYNNDRQYSNHNDRGNRGGYRGNEGSKRYR